MKSEHYLKVAVPSPLRTAFDYILPPQYIGKAWPGQRVRIPFGKRELVGIIVSISTNTAIEHHKLKPISALLDETPALDTPILDLYLWASDYYHFPVGQALQVSLPRAVRNGRELILAGQRVWMLTEKGQNEDPATLKRAPQQQKLFCLLKDKPLGRDAIDSHFTSSAHPYLKALESKGLIRHSSKSISTVRVKELFGHDRPLALNSAQQKALDTISQAPEGFSAHLLEGVTGSGKTEIYLQLIARVLAEGRQVLILIPEIGLTPQTISRFRQRFNRETVILHSGLSDLERFENWLKARIGIADIIIGTRSAIFTPLARPGLIIVDEEHDPSYKQQDGFRYSARDLSIYRARAQNIPVLLGSATPSLESLHNALNGRYQLHTLNIRAGASAIPRYRFIDLRGERMEEGFSGSLLTEIRFHLEQQHQVLIFLNRRGFAPLLQCHDCGWISTCPRCNKAYTLHQNPPALLCHHCDTRHPLIQHCPECAGKDIQAIGMGTERIEKVLETHFPDHPVIRVDRDTTRGKQSLNFVFDTINKGHPSLLVGTQMLAKGHHFPDVTLVAILDADSGLFSADFRGQEHMGQLLIQVSGRAGRGNHPGEVLIQTHHVEHPSLNTLVKDGYGPFARNLLHDRKICHLPPYTYQALLKAEASSRTSPEKFLDYARRICLDSCESAVQIVGPLPAPMEKRAGKFRFQLLLQADSRKILHQCCTTLIDAMESHPQQRQVRWAVDIDPLDFT